MTTFIARAIAFASLTAGLTWRCAQPPQASVPEGLEPARLASDDCEPPYPMAFAQENFFFADLDQNKTCTQFIEQDRCILGVFQDCIADDGQGAPDRQWAGRVQTEGAERRVQLTGTTNGAAGLSRSPTCCEGALLPATGGPVQWSLLACRLNRCGNARDAVHAGLYFERLRPSNDPQSRIMEPLPTTVRVEAGPVWIESRREVWLLADGQLERIPTDRSQPSSRIDIAPGVGRDLVAAGDAVFAATGRMLTRVAIQSLETTTVALEDMIDVMTITSEGVLVAFGFEAENNLSRLALFSLEGELVSTTTFEGQARHMTGIEGADLIAVIARRSVPNLLPIATGLVKLPIWDFTTRARDTDTAEITVRDMVEGFAVPRWIIQLPNGWVGFVDGCNDNIQTQCWFEVSADPLDRPVRVGIPNVSELGPVWYDVHHDRVVLGSEGGRVIVVNRAPLRPYLQDAISLDGELEGLTGTSAPGMCTATSTAYAYLKGPGELRPIVLTGLCEDG